MFSQRPASVGADNIDTWSYKYGLANSYIPSDVSNASTLVYPVLDSGCVDAGFNYTAPEDQRRSSAGRSVRLGGLGVVVLLLGSVSLLF